MSVRLVVVPGLGLDGRSWEPVAAAVDTALDPALDTALDPVVEVRPLPGYGLPAERSARRRLTPEDLGRRLGLDLRSGPRVVLAGHSSGAQVAAHAARHAGSAVAALVLIGPTTDPRAATWPRLAARWLRTAVHEDPRQVPGLARQYHRTGLRTMARAMDLARRDDLRATLAGLRVPVLVVRGPDDRICPVDWARALGRDVVTLDAGAHMVPSTHGPQVAAAVIHLLRLRGVLPGPGLG